MKRHAKVEDVLRSDLPTPSEYEVKSAGIRVLERLQANHGEAPGRAALTFDPAHRTDFRSVYLLAAAAAVVLAVLLPIITRPLTVATREIAARDVRFGEIVKSELFGEVVKLQDGSRIEMKTSSELVLERADDGVRIRLDKGDIVVTAAKQHGHLYVQTKDVTVSVVGTVFYVKAEKEGSRVAVFEGEVHVRQGQKETKLGPGDQVASSPNMESIPVTEQVAWSREAVAMLQQSASTTPSSPAGPIKFAAASVRLWPRVVDDAGNPTGASAQGFNTAIACLGVDGLLSVPANDSTPPRRGRCMGNSVSLDQVVFAAYASSYMSGMVGYPFTFPRMAWLQIEAVADDPERVTKGELKLMLQNLLEDRFKARVHFETRELDGYVLTIAKSGIKFKETPAGATPARCSNPNVFSVSGPCTMRDVVQRLERGLLGVRIVDDAGRLIARVPVNDKTDLTGIYDINFRLEDPRPRIEGAHAGGGGDGQNPGRLEFSPPVPKAVEDQLGLHLAPGKVQVEFIVIDQLELPTEN